MIKCKCPFRVLFDVDCVYTKDEYKICEEIDINPGNSDAWCTEKIELGLEKEMIDKGEVNK